MFFLIVRYLIMIVILIIIYAFFIETNMLKINRYNITKNKNSINNIRIVHVSDFHGKCRFFAGKISKIINSLNPDFIVITGDILNKYSQLDYMIDQLSQLKAKEDIIFVKGNHETYEGKFMGIFGDRKPIDDKQIVKRIKDINIRVLQEEYAEYSIKHKNIIIYGIDNSDFVWDRFNLNIKLDQWDYSIVLAHAPDSYFYLKENNRIPDMFLAGHTHGGQINIPFLFKIASKVFEHSGFQSGYHIDEENRVFSISKGLGNTTINARLRNQPELIIYDIKI